MVTILEAAIYVRANRIDRAANCNSARVRSADASSARIRCRSQHADEASALLTRIGFDVLVRISAQIRAVRGRDARMGRREACPLPSHIAKCKANRPLEPHFATCV